MAHAYELLNAPDQDLIKILFDWLTSKLGVDQANQCLLEIDERLQLLMRESIRENIEN